MKMASRNAIARASMFSLIELFFFVSTFGAVDDEDSVSTPFLSG
jgi:hypothetical protein